MSSHRSVTRRSVLKVLGAGLAMPAFIRNARAAEVTLRLHHFLPPVSAGHRTMFEPWAKKIMADSQNRIEVQIFPNMSLGGRPPEMVDQVRDGVADIGWALPHYQPGRYPLMESWTLPFMITNAAETSQAIWEFMNTTANTEFKDVVPLAWWAQSPGIFMTKGFGVETMADLKGKRIRGGNEIITKTLTLLGANGVFFPVTEAAQNLTTGTVDGVALPYEIVPAFRFHEIVDNFSEPAKGSRAFYSLPMTMVMNRPRYEKLPDDLRAVIDANAGAELSKKFGRIFDENDAGGRKIAEKSKAKFHTISTEEMKSWRTKSQPIFDEYAAKLTAAGHDGASVVKTVDTLVDKYAGA